MPSQGTGANVDPRSLKPSIDLATVIELLAQAIFPSSNQANPNQLNPKAIQLFEFDDKQNKRLRICTSAVRDFQRINYSKKNKKYVFSRMIIILRGEKRG
ncbi:hypothetical protein, partial [Nostoc sp.]|uniref:hypothetical protein n=2 Tax=unclassified Nostoc TaxID=2593658 RepID=UPI002FFC5083